MNLMKKDEQKQTVESRSGGIYRNPDCDILETSDAYLVYYDLPGVEKDDINIKLEKNILSLTAECSKSAGDDYECLRDEMIYSGFRRNFDLGEGVDPEAIAAEYRNGTLLVTIPKKEEQKTRQIQVTVA